MKEQSSDAINEGTDAAPRRMFLRMWANQCSPVSIGILELEQKGHVASLDVSWDQSGPPLLLETWAPTVDLPADNFFIQLALV